MMTMMTMMMNAVTVSSSTAWESRRHLWVTVSHISLRFVSIVIFIIILIVVFNIIIIVIIISTIRCYILSPTQPNPIPTTYSATVLRVATSVSDVLLSGERRSQPTKHPKCDDDWAKSCSRWPPALLGLCHTSQVMMRRRMRMTMMMWRRMTMMMRMVTAGYLDDLTIADEQKCSQYQQMMVMGMFKKWTWQHPPLLLWKT